MAPSTSMPDSFIIHSGWNSSSFSKGRICSSKSSLKTFARISSAAAEHFPTHTRENNEDNSKCLDAHPFKKSWGLGFVCVIFKHCFLLKFQSEMVSSSSKSSSSSSSSSMESPPSCCWATVRERWNLGRMSCSLSGIASSSSTSPWKSLTYLEIFLDKLTTIFKTCLA